ncbi:MAG: signal peptidase II [Aliifodinibius sp.]|nr:signal peptidase II [Fodinibius sp.]
MQKPLQPSKTNNDLNSINQEDPEIRRHSPTTLIPLLLGAGLIILLDQWTKSLVVKNIPFLGTWLPDNLAQFGHYFRIVHWRNSGAAFGMFSNGNMIFLILAIIASIFIIAFYPLIEKEEWTLRLAMVLQLGGALGNMIDRIRYGYVIDFLSIRNFPVFNIADTCISLGVAILLLGVILQEIKAQKSKQLLGDLKIQETTRKEEAE